MARTRLSIRAELLRVRDRRDRAPRDPTWGTPRAAQALTLPSPGGIRVRSGSLRDLADGSEYAPRDRALPRCPHALDDVHDSATRRPTGALAGTGRVGVEYGARRHTARSGRGRSRSASPGPPTPTRGLGPRGISQGGADPDRDAAVPRRARPPRRRAAPL